MRGKSRWLVHLEAAVSVVMKSTLVQMAKAILSSEESTTDSIGNITKKLKENASITLLPLIQSSKDVSHKCSCMYRPFEKLL